ncbi:MAG: hypothetical protein CMF59_15830 [Leptospiraceae bacterium]|nr:hypothetical protein [Leptospiraceae bacterium]
MGEESVSEFFALVLSLTGFFLLLGTVRHSRIPGQWLLLVSFGAIAASNVATVAEHYALPDILNLLEHCLLLTGAIFLSLGIWKIATRKPDDTIVGD